MVPKNPLARASLPLAHEIRQKAEHYNGFKVGAVGYACGPFDGYVLLQGANTKRAPDEPKDCAEMKIMREAEKSGWMLKGLVVVGKPRKEDQTLTLHPCEACRRLMRAYMRADTVVRPSTHITCVNPSNSCVEEFTVESLHVAHDEPLDSD